jgi:hypothetical protein
MHPTIAQGLVQQRHAAFLHAADADRRAAQARRGRSDRSVLDRLAATAARIRVGIGRTDPTQPAAQEPLTDRRAAHATRPTHDTPASLAPALRPVTWARAGGGSFGAAGRTLTGSSDVAPPSPSL